MEERKFTRSDVEAYFMENYGKYYIESGNSVEIHEARLLKELTSPTWTLEYTVTTQLAMGEHPYHGLKVIIQITTPAGTVLLGPPYYSQLPPGCATVAEEDKAIEENTRKMLEEATKKP